MWEIHYLSTAASHTLPVLIDAAIKGLVLLTLAGIATAAMRRSSAAARHMIWSLAVVGLLALPIFSGTLPGWQILPSWMNIASETASAPESAPVPPPASVIPRVPLPDPVQGNTSPKVEPQPRPGRQLWVWLPFVWAAGALGVLGWLGAGFLNLWWLRRSCEPIADNAWTALLAHVADELNIRSSVSLMQRKHRSMPMVWGIFRPRLLVPVEACDWPADYRRTVLLHELAHVKRRDPLVQLITQLASALYWFNPLAWIAAGRMVTERERACDDLVLSAGSPACDYADQILQIASGLRARPWAGAAAIAMARPSHLEGRLLAILDDRRSRRALTRTATAVLAAVFTAVVVPVGMMRAAAPGQEAMATQALAEQAGIWFPKDATIRVGDLGFQYAGGDTLSVFDYANPNSPSPSNLHMHIKIRFPHQVNQIGGHEVRILNQTADRVQASIKKIDSTEKFGYGIYFGIRSGDAIRLEGGSVKITAISKDADPAVGERVVSFEASGPQGAEQFTLAPATEKTTYPQKDLKYCTLWIRWINGDGLGLEVMDSPSQGSPYEHTRCGGPLPAAAAQTPRAKTQTPSRTPASRQPRPAAGLPN